MGNKIKKKKTTILVVDSYSNDVNHFTNEKEFRSWLEDEFLREMAEEEKDGALQDLNCYLVEKEFKPEYKYTSELKLNI